MSDKMRWRWGDTNPVIAAVDAETVIEIGDLLWLDVDDAKPASDVPLATNSGLWETFAAAFLGVAMQRSTSGDTTPIRVATSGVFEFDRDRLACCELGDLVGAQLRAVTEDGPVELENQGVEVCDLTSQAIARVARRAPNPVNTVIIAIQSTVMTGGILTR